MKGFDLPVFAWEEKLLFALVPKREHPHLDRLMILFSNPYQWILPFAAFCLVLLWIDWRQGLTAIIIGGVAGGLADTTNTRLIKGRLRRVRPSQRYPQIEALGIMNTGRFSFPSNHAANSMAVAVALALYFPALSPVLLLTVGVIGYSRIYCGAHYPLDIIAGWLVGGFWSLVLYSGWNAVITTALGK